jgi:hypothetical protein
MSDEPKSETCDVCNTETAGNGRRRAALISLRETAALWMKAVKLWSEKPVVNYAWLGLVDSLTCVVFFIGGVMLCLGWLIGHRGWTWYLLAASQVALLLTAVVTQTSWRRVADIQRQLIDEMRNALRDAINENTRLRDVALAAVALEMSIEHGFTPDLGPLKRALAPYRIDVSPGSQSIN